MADYISAARTNYFRVRDLDAFRADLTRHGISHAGWYDPGCASLVIEDDRDNVPQGSIALFPREGSWPVLSDEDGILDSLPEGVACNAFAQDPEGACTRCGLTVVQHVSSEAYHDDFVALVAAHLVDGDVAVLVESGHEKLRYVGGCAVAVNSKGQVDWVNLDAIYDRAARLGTTVTHAHY